MEIDDDYIRHQRNILKCLKFEVSSLNDTIKQLIKARSNTLHKMNAIQQSDIDKNKQEKELDEFVNEIMNEIKEQEKEKEVIALDKLQQILTRKRDLSLIHEEEEKSKTNINWNNMELSNWEIQEFERENQEMVKLLEEEHKEVVAAEQKTTEIVELLSLFIEQVMNQDSVVANIDSAILQSLEDLMAGNKQLERAQKRGKQTRTIFITIVSTLAFSLLFLDWYKS